MNIHKKVVYGLFSLSLLFSQPLWAHGHGGGGYHGGGHWGGGGWGHRHAFYGGFYSGGYPYFGYGYPYYGFGYPYYGYGFGYPYYSRTIITSPPTPPVYIERAAPAQESGYWYYCNNPKGYYPTVKECPGGWLQVAPEPTP